MTRSRADSILSTANCADIILFIDGHPGCMKTDIYRNITRNAHTPDMMRRLVEAELIIMDDEGNRSSLSLTSKGSRVAVILRQLDDVLSSDP